MYVDDSRNQSLLICIKYEYVENDSLHAEIKRRISYILVR